MDEKQTRDYTLFLHLSALSWIISIPGFIGPLIMWLIKKDESAIVDRHGKAAMNFQISLLIYGVALVIVGVLFTIVTFGLALILIIPLAIALFVISVVFPILAGLAAQKGQDYRYPLAIEFLR